MFTFVETKLFTRLVQESLTDDEYAAVQRALIADPDAGSVTEAQAGYANSASQRPGEASGVGTG